jgi:8-amino-7-oxononanoate synthase
MQSEVIAGYVGRLEGLEREGLLRRPDDRATRAVVEDCARTLGVPFVDSSSNDYLGYRAREIGGGDRKERAEGVLIGVSRETWSCPTGSGASRLLGGTHHSHHQLEQAVSDWVGQERALLFSSGYAANVGVLPALVGEADILFSDSLNHASIVDGAKLSKGRTLVYCHRDIDHLAHLLRSTTCAGQRWLITESYFSMDGDSPDLRALSSLLADQRVSLIVDEAHAMGVFGPKGAGLCAHHQLQPLILIGTFGKSIGTQGAFVAAPMAICTWLWNRARSFVYSTATSPLLAALTLERLTQAQSDDSGRERLHQLGCQVRQALTDAGIPVAPDSIGPIIPILVGESSRAVSLASYLQAQGIVAYAVRPPTVPRGTARLRLTLRADFTDVQVAHLTTEVRKGWQQHRP